MDIPIMLKWNCYLWLLICKFPEYSPEFQYWRPAAGSGFQLSCPHIAIYWHNRSVICIHICGKQTNIANHGWFKGKMCEFIDSRAEHFILQNSVPIFPDWSFFKPLRNSWEIFNNEVWFGISNWHFTWKFIVWGKKVEHLQSVLKHFQLNSFAHTHH